MLIAELLLALAQLLASNTWPVDLAHVAISPGMGCSHAKLRYSKPRASRFRCAANRHLSTGGLTKRRPSRMAYSTLYAMPVDMIRAVKVWKNFVFNSVLCGALHKAEVRPAVFSPDRPKVGLTGPWGSKPTTSAKDSLPAIGTLGHANDRFNFRECVLLTLSGNWPVRKADVQRQAHMPLWSAAE